MEGLQAGDPLRAGQYRLVGRLGGGGMGQVFLGRSPGGRLVAVKVIRAELAESSDFRARFGREVAVARQVSGLFTALVVDADTEGHMPWLATAYVSGPSLTEAVTAHGPLPTDTVLALAGGLVEGLADVHAAGIVHRDLKPSNVLLAHDGPRLIDFGISRAVESSALTHTGQIVGSPGFMSPEQAEGLEVGPASDIFSLGAVLVYAATGVGPFGTGSTAALVYRVVHAQPELGRVPALIRPMVEQCLAKDPVQRPAPEQILAGLADAQPDADPVRWLPSSILQDFAESAPAGDRTPGGGAVQASTAPSEPGRVAVPGDPALSAPAGASAGSNPARPADPAAAGAPSTATTARPYQARHVPGPAEQPAPEIAWPASVVPPLRVPPSSAAQAASASAEPGWAAPRAWAEIDAAAPGAMAKPRARRWSWVVAASAVAAVLGLAVGMVMWAPWARHPAPRRPAASPPLSAAVLAGTDIVHYKDVMSYGTRGSKPRLRTDTWSFTPTCAVGPCSVNLVGTVGGSQFTAKLQRSGAVYRGKATLEKDAVCGSVSYPSRLHIQVTVLRGNWVDRKWRAASWVGQLILHSPSTAKCYASGIKASVYSSS